MKIKFKKVHDKAALPSYAREGDAGLDLTAVDCVYDQTYDNYIYRTGLSVEIPSGYVGLLFPRSSIFKTKLSVVNSVGVIDSGFRGEITLRMAHRIAGSGFPYCEGERIGQLVIIPFPSIEPEFADELSTTVRGTGGYGSTGS